MGNHRLFWTQGGVGQGLPIGFPGSAQDQFKSHLAVDMFCAKSVGDVLGAMVAPFPSPQLPLSSICYQDRHSYICLQCAVVLPHCNQWERPKFSLTMKLALVEQMPQIL